MYQEAQPNQATQEKIVREPPPEALRGSRRGRARPLVLIVDDDPDARAIHADVLRQRGFRSAEAADGESGIEAAIAATPDVILMDCAMPGMSGADAARRLKRDRRTCAIPIVMLTGFAASTRPGESSCDCDAYITKPSSADSIAATLRAILASGDRANER